jgi:hypothetical protein
VVQPDGATGAGAGAGAAGERVIPWLGFERRWRDALIAAALPGHGPLPGAGGVDLAPFWRELAAVAPPLLRFGLRASVWALALSPPWLLGRWRTFAGLSDDDRDRLLVRALHHRRYLVRQMALTLKTLACFGYFRDPAARAAVLR